MQGAPCRVRSSCAAPEWAEWRTSPELGGPQANQERLSRYKASQSGGGAPVPHSLPSQIVTMGTITKKDSSQMQSFPGKFLPFSPTFSSLHPLLPLTSVPWLLEGVRCVCVCVQKCSGSRRAGCRGDRHPTFPRYSRPPAAMLQCGQTIGWGKPVGCFPSALEC